VKRPLLLRILRKGKKKIKKGGGEGGEKELVSRSHFGGEKKWERGRGGESTIVCIIILFPTAKKPETKKEGEKPAGEKGRVMA